MELLRQERGNAGHGVADSESSLMLLYFCSLVILVCAFLCMSGRAGERREVFFSNLFNSTINSKCLRLQLLPGEEEMTLRWSSKQSQPEMAPGMYRV